MTARDTYVNSVATALTAKVATNVANANTHQETINASGVNAGNPTGRGAGSALMTATANANAAYAAAKLNAEMVKQIAIQAAKDTLRSTGDTAPA